MLFYPAQYGYFFGEIKYQDVTDNILNKTVPYEPKFKSQLIYGYDFKFGFGIKAEYQMAYEIFTNAGNTVKLDNYQNLSLSCSYKFWDSLTFTADFHNILNKSNFVWMGYQEKPFDIILGAEYRW